jgi:hypothetical protein
MSEIILLDNKKHDKQCPDWVPLKDGTRCGDSKYCDLSTECKQIGMKTDWYEFRNEQTNEYDFDYFCTGMYATDENKRDDDEVS